MQPVHCGSCGVAVEARKSCWAQTSIQWHADGLSACPERRASGSRLFTGCEALRDSVQAAVAAGRLTVIDPSVPSLTQE
jgi:hypothetical protein